jgi:hypothetical protein
MSAPDLTVTVEPTSGDKLYYQLQAPSFKGVGGEIVGTPLRGAPPSALSGAPME